MVKHGNFSYLDPRYKTSSYAEGKLVEVLGECTTHNPDDRPSVFELVDFLRTAKMEAEKLGGKVE